MARWVCWDIIRYYSLKPETNTPTLSSFFEPETKTKNDQNMRRELPKGTGNSALHSYSRASFFYSRAPNTEKKTYYCLAVSIGQRTRPTCRTNNQHPAVHAVFFFLPLCPPLPITKLLCTYLLPYKAEHHHRTRTTRIVSRTWHKRHNN